MNEYNRYFILMSDDQSSEENKYLKGDKENNTLTIVNSEEINKEFDEEHIFLNRFLFNLIWKKVNQEVLSRVKIPQNKKMRNFLSLICNKNNKYYQLVIDSNNFTYNIYTYKNKNDVSSSVYLEQFVFDFLISIIIDLGFICFEKKISKEIVFDALKGLFSSEILLKLSNCNFENADYYNYEILVQQINKYYNNQMETTEFNAWCVFIISLFEKVQTQNTKISNSALKTIFTITNLNTNEKNTHFLYAALKYLNFYFNNPNKEFESEGVIRYVCLNDIQECKILIIDTINNRYNYLTMKELKYIDQINYSFIGIEQWGNEDVYELEYGYSNNYYFDIYFKMFKLINRDIYTLDVSLI